MEQDAENSLQSFELQDPLDAQDVPLKKRRSRNVSVDASGFIISIVEEADQKGLIDEGEIEIEKPENVMLGVTLMMGAVLSITTAHGIVKYLSMNSPYLRPYDFTGFMGVMLTSFNLIFAFVTKSNLNIFSYGGKAATFIILRVVFGVVCNICIVYGISQVPLSKSVFIYSLAPVCCAILAAIFLKETLTKTMTACMVGGAIGIYILTMSKSGDGKSGSLAGYISLFCAMMTSGSVYIFVKYLSIYKVHTSVVSVAFGVSFIIQPLIFMTFQSDVMSFGLYTLTDVILLSVHGLLAVSWITFIFLASTYARASIVAPLMNLENVFSVFIDLFFFHYHFTNYDIVGMSVVAVCIGILVAQNLRG